MSGRFSPWTELIDAFSLERVGQSGVQFDLKKLQWFNEQRLRERGDAELADQLATEAEERFGCTDRDYLTRAVSMMKERMSFARDLFDADYLFTPPQGYDEKAVAKRWKADSSGVLKDFADTLETCTEWDEASLEATLKSFIESEGVGMGAIMFPLRMALSGVGGGPSLYALMDLIGKEETLDRIRKALDELPSGQ